MFIGLYILYAFVQAILVSRYLWTDPTAPVAKVVFMALFAPVVSLGITVHYSGELIRWLATPRVK